MTGDAIATHETNQVRQRPERLYGKAMGLYFLYQDQLEVDGYRSPMSVLKAAARGVFIVRHTATTLFRLSQLTGQRSRLAGAWIKQINHVLTGADIAWRASVGPGLVLHHPTGVVIGPQVIIGNSCRIQQGVTLGGKGGTGMDGSPRIGRSAHLGSGSKILGGVTLGDDVIVGANAVVLIDVPSGMTAAGVPARLIGR